MSGIIVGNGLGLFNSSLSLLNQSFGSSNLGQSNVGSYVNARTGNLTINQQDTRLVGLGLDANLLRTYNSQGQILSDRDNWDFGISRLRIDKASPRLFRTTASGTEVAYLLNTDNGRYESTDGNGAHDYIIETGDIRNKAYKWHRDGDTGFVEEFNRRGQLVKQYDRDGNVTEFSFTNTGRITSITTSGQVLRFNYTGINVTSVVSEITDSDSGEVSYSTVARYTYDNYRRLSSVTIDLTPTDNNIDDGKAYQTNYTYDGYSKRIASVTQSDGSSISFSYVLQGSGGPKGGGTYKVETVTYGNGEQMTYTYGGSNANGEYTTVTNALGQDWLYFHDENGHLTRMESPAVDGQRLVTKYAYDVDGNVISITDPENNTTVYEYDNKGNRVLERDSLGNTIKRTYNDNNQLLAETVYLIADPDGAGSALPGQPITSRYTYDEEGHLRFALNAEGEVIEYRYQDNGLRAQQIIYSGNSYDLSTLTEEQAPALPAMTAWITGVDKSQSQLTTYTYDFRGQMTSSSVYSSVDVNGNGTGTAAKTTYLYDYKGRLLETISPRGNETVTENDYRTIFAYDGLGRLISTTDADGNISSTQYLDDSQKIVTESANGLYRTTIYDAAGRIVNVSQSNSVSNTDNLGQSLFYYDDGGRLRATKNVDGSISYVFYDDAGRVSANVDGSGSVVEYQYNKRGQVIKVTAYASEANTTNWLNLTTDEVVHSNIDAIRPTPNANDRVITNIYDDVGRLSQTIDGENTVTTLTYDGAGRVIKSQTGDRFVRNFYDNAGRLVATQDARGALTENVYDKAGQLIQTIAYANLTTDSLRATGTLDELRPLTNPTQDAITYNYYNDRGQLIGQLNAESYLTSMSYDLDGNLTQRREYYNATSHSGSSDNYTAPIEAATDRISSYHYNQLGQLAQSTNYEGTITEYVYDSVGNLIKSEVASRRSYQAYDEKGQLTHSVNGEGSEELGVSATEAQIEAKAATHGTRFVYDNSGRVVKSLDSNGHATIYYYDLDGNATITVNADGGVTQTIYNAFGELEASIAYAGIIDTTDLNGGLVDSTISARIDAVKNDNQDTRTEFEYNHRGQLQQILQQILNNSGQISWNKTEHTYDQYADKRTTTELIQEGELGQADKVRFTAFTYNANSQLTSSWVNPEVSTGQRNLVDYDAFGRAIKLTDAKGFSVTSEYDRLGRVISITDAEGGISKSEFDSFNQIVISTDQLGQKTLYSYNDATKTITIESPDGNKVQTSHNEFGETVKVINARGYSTYFNYDANGNLSEQENALGENKDFQYDQAGRLLWSTDEKGTKTSFTYDVVGRVLTQTLDSEGLALATSYSYDGKGQTLTVTDARGTVTETKYDKRGQVKEIIKDPSGLNIRTQFTYDGLGNQLSIIDAAGSDSVQETSYIFDDSGRRISMTQDPDGISITTRYEYDKNNNVSQSIDAKGIITAYEYDKNNRLIKTVQDVGGLEITTQSAYDAKGQLIKSIDAKGVETGYHYTADGLLNLEFKDVGGLNIRTIYEYDANNNLRSMVDARGTATFYNYDALDRVYSTTRDFDNLRVYTINEYDEVGNMIRHTDGNGNLTHYIYDNADRLIFTVNPENYLSQNIYDDAGNLIEQRQYHNALAEKVTWTEGEILAAITQNSPIGEEVIFNENFNMYITGFGFTNGGPLNNSISHTNNALHFTNQLYEGGHYSDTVYRNQGHSFSDGVTTRFEITGQRLNSPISFKAAVISDDGNFYHGIKIAGNGSSLGMSVFSNTSQQILLPSIYFVEGKTYVVEIVEGDVGTTLYYYEKGKARGDGIENRTELGGSNPNMSFKASTVASSNVGGGIPGTVILDNYSETKVTSLSSFEPYTEQHYAYDAIGRNTYTVDGEGYTTEAVYDQLGQVIESKQFDHNISLARDDWSEQSIRDSVNENLTLHGSDSKNATAYIQDSANRNVYSVDSEGYVTQNLFDKNNNIRQTKVYDRKISTAGLTTPAQIEIAINAAYQIDGATPSYSSIDYRYDTLNRVKNIIDGEGYVTERFYDANGNLQEIKQYDTKIDKANVSDTALLLLAATSDNISNKFVTDNLGRTVYQIDDLGYVTRYAYDKNSNLVTSGRSSQSIDTSQFDWTNPNLVGLSLSGIIFQYTRYTYDQLNRVTSTTDALYNTESYTYDANGNRITLTNKNGHTWNYSYNKNNQLIEELSPQVDYYYRKTSANGATFTNGRFKKVFTYDYMGQVTSIVDAAGTNFSRTTSYQYDKVGNQIQVTHPQVGSALNFTETFHDARGLAVANKDFRGNYSYKTYTDNQQIEFEVDALGYVTHHQYDAFGNEVKVTRYANAISVSGRGSNAFESSEVQGLLSASGNDRVLTMHYDANNRQTGVVQSSEDSYYQGATTNGSGYTATPETKFEYDALGNVTKQSVKVDNNRWADTYFYYDDNNRRIGSLNSERYLTVTEYDAHGNMSKTTAYARQLSSSVDFSELPSPPAAGNSVLGKDRVTIYEYDALNRQTKVIRTLDNGSNVTFSETGYDAVGNVLTTKDVYGQTSTNTLDALGRTTKVTASERTVGNSFTNAFANVNATPTVEYKLDIHGNVLEEVQFSGQSSAVAATRTLRNFYDEQGRLTKELDAHYNAIDYRYDAFGRVIETSQEISANPYRWFEGNYSYTKKTRYQYNAIGQQTITITDATVNGDSNRKITQKSFYNGFGEQTKASIKDNTSSEYTLATYSYDKNGNLVSSNERGIDKSFHYNLAGSVTKQTIGGSQSTINQYDTLGRVTRQQLPTFTGVIGSTTLKRPTVEQTYDAFGNAIEVKQKHETESGAIEDAITKYQYSFDNKLLKKIEPLVSYMNELGRNVDSQGNRLELTPTTTYKYNVAGQVIEIEDAKGNKQYKIYDSIGNLIQERDALNARTYHAYNAFGDKIATKNAIGIVTTEHYDKLGQVTQFSVIRNGSEKKLRAFHYDQAGNKVMVWNYFDSISSVDYVQYDQNGQALKTRNGAGLESHYKYDILGNKVYESDGNTRTADSDFSHKTWDYSIETGRLSGKSDLEGNETTYTYNILGQLLHESSNYYNIQYDQNYEYYQNGLLKRINYTETQTSDWINNQSTESLQLEYDISGNRTKEIHDIHRVNDFSTGTYQTTRTETIAREMNYSFDALNRLVKVVSPKSPYISAVSSPTGDISSLSFTSGLEALTYQYDENGNRRYVESKYSESGAGYDKTIRHYYDYDGMNRLIVSQGVLTGGGIGISKDKGTSLTYDALGQRKTSETFTESFADIGYRTINHEGQVRTRRVRGDKYIQERYSYNDLGQMSQIDTRTNWKNLKYEVIVNGSGGPGTLPLIPIDGDGDPIRFWVHYKTQEQGSYKIQNQKTYDDMGRLKKDKSYQNGALKTTTDTEYYLDGRIKNQFQYTHNNGQTFLKVHTQQDGNVNVYVPDYGGAYTGTHHKAYDKAGNISAYQVKVYHDNTNNLHYTNTYTKKYRGFDSYKENVAEIKSDLPNYESGRVGTLHDLKGQIILATGNGGDEGSFTRRFFNSLEGNALYRSEFGGKGEDFYYYKGNLIGSVGQNGDAEFDYNFQPVSASYPASTPNNHIINASDTLGSIAQSVYGDSSLWYVIANANSLSNGKNDTDLKPGQRLTIPNIIGNIRNDSDTFKPYNPSDVIGDLTPSLEFVPPPPPPQKKGCGIIATILIVIVAVVVTVYTAGAGAALFGGVAGATTTAGAGAAVLGGAAIGTGFAGVATGIGVAAVAGAVGAAAGQLAALALDVQDKFSWKDVALGGLTSAIGAGVGAAAKSLGAAKWISGGEAKTKWLRQAVFTSSTAVVSQAANYGANQLLDNKSKFNWGSLATTAIAAPLAGAAGEAAAKGAGKLGARAFTQQVTSTFVSNSVNSVAQQVIAKNGKYEWTQVAADAFGNALAGSIINEMGKGKEHKKLEQERQEVVAVNSLQSEGIKPFQPPQINGELLTVPLQSSARSKEVSRGDTFYSLAEQLLGNPYYFPAIMDANGISGEQINAGQKLIIPDLSRYDLGALEQRGRQLITDFSAQRQVTPELTGSPVVDEIIEDNRQTYGDIRVRFGLNLDKDIRLNQLLRLVNDDYSWYEARPRHSFFMNPAQLSASVYRNPENGNTIYEYNFVVEASDRWSNVPKNYQNAFGAQPSLAGDYHYAQALSIKAEGPALPDYFFNEAGYAEGDYLDYALDNAEYYENYYDRTRDNPLTGQQDVISNFVVGTQILGGQQYVEQRAQQQIKDFYGPLSFLSHGTKFWDIVNSLGGLGAKGGSPSRSTVGTSFTNSRPNGNSFVPTHQTTTSSFFKPNNTKGSTFTYGENLINSSTLQGGRLFETQQLSLLGKNKNNSVWRPSLNEVNSAAFQTIVGKPKFTPGGKPVGTIFDSKDGGYFEIKGGRSPLNSSYQLRLQTYKAVRDNIPYTIQTIRKPNATFQKYLNSWGVNVVKPGGG